MSKKATEIQLLELECRIDDYRERIHDRMEVFRDCHNELADTVQALCDYLGVDIEKIDGPVYKVKSKES